MDTSYILEAWKEMDNIPDSSETVDLYSADAAANIENFLKDDEKIDFLDVIDPDAETEEDIKPTYVGKIGVSCLSCGSLFFKNRDELVFNEDKSAVCEDDECLVCGSHRGYKIEFDAKPFEDVTVTVTDKEESNDENKPEEDKHEEKDDDDEKKKNESLNESVYGNCNWFWVTADNITISDKPVYTSHNQIILGVPSTIHDPEQFIYNNMPNWNGSYKLSCDKVTEVKPVSSFENWLTNDGHHITSRALEYCKANNYAVYEINYNGQVIQSGYNESLSSREQFSSSNDVVTAAMETFGFSQKDAKEYASGLDSATAKELVKGWKDNAKKSALTDSMKIEEELRGVARFYYCPSIHSRITVDEREVSEKEADSYCNSFNQDGGYEGKDGNKYYLDYEWVTTNESLGEDYDYGENDSFEDMEDGAYLENELGLSSDQVNSMLDAKRAGLLKGDIKDLGEDDVLTFFDLTKEDVDNKKKEIVDFVKKHRNFGLFFASASGSYVLLDTYYWRGMSGPKDAFKLVIGHPLQKYEIDESLTEVRRLKEDLNNISLDTEDQHIEIKSEPKKDDPDAMMAGAIDDLEQQKIIDSSAENEEQPEEEEAPLPTAPEEEEDSGMPLPPNESLQRRKNESVTSKTKSYTITDFDEKKFKRLGESYLRKVYENVKSYDVSNVYKDKGQLVVEGIIEFKSGSKKNTSFRFNASEASKDGRCKFIGENYEITSGKKNAFTLSGKVSDKKFIPESLNYNYRQRNAEGKSSKVYGTVKAESALKRTFTKKA